VSYGRVLSSFVGLLAMLVFVYAMAYYTTSKHLEFHHRISLSYALFVENHPDSDPLVLIDVVSMCIQ
jgi:hypothetical protein